MYFAARLPFQLLSPGVKNPVASSPIERKRKASENSSDDDIVIVESTEVKENKISQLEKKPKITNKESDQVSEVKGNENVGDKMEVDEDIPETTVSDEISKDSNEKNKTVDTPKPRRGRSRKNPNSTPPSAKSKVNAKGKVSNSKSKTKDRKNAVSKTLTTHADVSINLIRRQVKNTLPVTIKDYLFTRVSLRIK